LLSFALALTREGQILGEDNAISLNRPQEAVDFLRRSFNISGEFARRDSNDFQSHNHAFSAETKLAGILRHTEPLRALELYDDGLQRLARAKDNAGARGNEARTLAASTYPLQRLGRNVEARKRLDAAFERLSQLKLYPAERIELGSETDLVVRALADFEAGSGNAGRAADVYRELVERVLAAKPKPETSLTDAVALSNLYRAAAPIHRRAGQAAPAASLEARRLELWWQWGGRFPHNTFIRRQLEAARLP
jgi:hypothetical protein